LVSSDPAAQDRNGCRETGIDLFPRPGHIPPQNFNCKVISQHFADFQIILN